MPVKQYKESPRKDHTDLTSALLTEWNDPHSNAEEPVILEERVMNTLRHIYVVWSKFTPLDALERSQVIMDAAEQKLTRPELLNITIAMGLTPQEAKEMNIDF